MGLIKGNFELGEVFEMKCTSLKDTAESKSEENTKTDMRQNTVCEVKKTDSCCFSKNKLCLVLPADFCQNSSFPADITQSDLNTPL